MHNLLTATDGANLNRIQAIMDRLVREANSKVVSVVDKDGQLIAASGRIGNLDTVALATLAASNIAASGGIAKLLAEREFTTQFHEGVTANIHLRVVAQRLILIVIFDADSSSGLVRLRVRRASQELSRLLAAGRQKAVQRGAGLPSAAITDGEIADLVDE